MILAHSVANHYCKSCGGNEAHEKQSGWDLTCVPHSYTIKLKCYKCGFNSNYNARTIREVMAKMENK